jgi:single-stranded-DNA-specific exonuclease
VGVVYKFLEFYCDYLKKDYDLQLDLDLVTIGTIADVVPLIGTNRTLVKNGLSVLAKRKRPGIAALLEVIRFNKPEISARDVGFMIAPYINASGRLESAKIAVDLLLSQDYDTALRHASKLRVLNEQRQQLGVYMLKDAKKNLNERELSEHNLLVLSGTDWHSGIIGITASQLAQEYYRPVVLISSNQAIARGSARSFANINIYELLKSCSEYFTEFGGHTQAAVFSIKNEKIEEFKEKLLSLSKANISENDLIPVIEIDCKINPLDINIALIRELMNLAPFGQNNPAPVFYCKDLLPIDFKTVGDGSHLKVTFSEKSGKFVFDAIGFGLSSKLNLLYNKNVELVFNLELNTWSGQEMAQLKLVDIK